MNLKPFSKHSVFIRFLFGFLFAVIFCIACHHDPDTEGTHRIKIPMPSVIRGDGELFIGWSAEDGLEYEVWYGSANNTENALKWDGLITVSPPVAGTTVTGLSDTTTYYVWIRVYDEGELSDFANVTAESPEGPPTTIPDGFVYVPGGTLAGSDSYAMTITVPTDPPGYMNAGQTLSKKGVFVENRIVPIDSFFMAKYETTRQLWYTVQSWAEGNGYSFQNRINAPSETTKNRPVVNISWRDAIVWCNAYSEMSSLEPAYYFQESVLMDSRNDNKTACDGALMNKSKNGYRLPTEVEREYAARGGNPGKIDWMFLFAGSDNADEVAWYHGNSPYTISDVGQKNSNRLGIFDLSGNVQQWGWDWMHYASAVTSNTPVDGELYSSRFNQKPMAGGGVGSNITMSCVADRWSYSTNYRDGYVGFRLARNVK
jgi:formylglycine-generating enzyme required for sulfatase activity